MSRWPLTRSMRGPRPGGVAGGRAARAGEGHPAGQRLSVHGELPADVVGQRGQRLGGLGHVGVVADVGDARSLRVEPLGLCADDGLVEPAGAALEERAVLVDEGVVADVVPAVRVAVIPAYREHDRRRLLGRVVVERDGVVHVDSPHAAVLGSRTRRAPVGAPVLAGDVRGRWWPVRHVRSRRHARTGFTPRSTKCSSQAAHTPAQAVLHGAGRPTQIGSEPATRPSPRHRSGLCSEWAARWAQRLQRPRRRTRSSTSGSAAPLASAGRRG